MQAQDDHELYARFFAKWEGTRLNRRHTPTFEEFQAFEPTTAQLRGFGFTEDEVW